MNRELSRNCDAGNGRARFLTVVQSARNMKGLSHAPLYTIVFFTGKTIFTLSKYPAFLEKRSGVWGEGKNLFSREKKVFLVPRIFIYLDRTAGKHSYLIIAFFDTKNCD